MFDALRDKGFEVETKNHAEAILSADFRPQVRELIAALDGFSMRAQELIKSGGGEAESTQRLRRELSEKGWLKHNFVISLNVDGIETESMSHEIDHVRRSAAGTIALELEWNNKDPFFDRDLENFQRLHAQSVISLGIVITRGSGLQNNMRQIVSQFIRSRGILEARELERFGMKQRTARQEKLLDVLLDKHVPFADAFAKSFVSDKFGQATTHWQKLTDRINRGVGNPCPLLLIGLPASVVVP
jgi:Restriction endonuclease BglII